MILDLSQPEDKLRLRVGDFSDILILPTSVYTTTLAENNDNVARCVPIIATYILAIFAQQTHSKLQYMEIWGHERFTAYKDWLLKVVLNPILNQSSPIPYSTGLGASAEALYANKSKLERFVEDWNKAYVPPTQSEDIHEIGLI